MRPESDTQRLPVGVSMRVLGANAALRSYYRSLREVGLPRYETNFLVAGVALATGTGRVDWRTL